MKRGGYVLKTEKEFWKGIKEDLNKWKSIINSWNDRFNIDQINCSSKFSCSNDDNKRWGLPKWLSSEHGKPWL